MPIPVRLLRASLQPSLDQRLPLKPADLRRREAILDFAQRNMALFGRPNLSFRRFAEAIRLSPGSIKRLFADMDALLGEILRRHLASISKALGEIPPDAPDRAARLRKTYLAETRNPVGGFREAHQVLLQDRHLLPEDELASVETMRNAVATLLGGTLGAETLDLLDAPSLSAAQIEFLLEQLPHAPAEAPAQPPAEAKLETPLEAPPETRPDAADPASPDPPPGTFYLTYPGRPKHPDDPPFLLPVRAGARAGPDSS